MDRRPMAYDESWPSAFAEARQELRELLGPLLVADVEHVGSTSVPGLRAKPIIDLIAGITSLDLAAADTDIRRALLARGYAYRPHRSEAHLFVRVDPGTGLDTHHLHLTTPGSDLRVERLAFRDALRADDDLATRYAAWKVQHATGDPHGAYDAIKTPFVAEVLRARGIELRPRPPG